MSGLKEITLLEAYPSVNSGLDRFPPELKDQLAAESITPPYPEWPTPVTRGWGSTAVDTKRGLTMQLGRRARFIAVETGEELFAARYQYGTSSKHQIIVVKESGSSTINEGRPAIVKYRSSTNKDVQFSDGTPARRSEWFVWSFEGGQGIVEKEQLVYRYTAVATSQESEWHDSRMTPSTRPSSTYPSSLSRVEILGPSRHREDTEESSDRPLKRQRAASAVAPASAFTPVNLKIYDTEPPRLPDLDNRRPLHNGDDVASVTDDESQSRLVETFMSPKVESRTGHEVVFRRTLQGPDLARKPFSKCANTQDSLLLWSRILGVLKKGDDPVLSVNMASFTDEVIIAKMDEDADQFKLLCSHLRACLTPQEIVVVPFTW